MSKQLEFYDTFPIKLSDKGNPKRISIEDSKKEIKDGYSLICEVDATHSGTLINNRVYPPDSMQSGIRTWTSPYKKPVLVNHDDSQDPIGRVVSARYIKTEKGMKLADEYKPILKESSGYGYQRLTIKVTDPEAIQKVLDGRYETVSVRMSTDHAYCSICNTDWSGDGGPCEHIPGTKYEGKLAYMTTGSLSYREVSFVNIPADEYAGVKEAILSGTKDALEVKLYANNDSEKVLKDMSTGENLYALLDSNAEESDDVVAYLIDKSNKAKQINKEEEVKLSELTRDQLQELDLVKTIIQEAVDKATQKMKDDLASEAAALEAAKVAEASAVEAAAVEAAAIEAAAIEATKVAEAAAAEAAAAVEAAAKKDAVEETEDQKAAREILEKEALDAAKKEEEEKKEKEAGSVENPNSSSDASSETNLQDENKRILDENVRINSELHKMIAERLYDLKKSLRKADVVGITTPEARNQKIEEFAQRSIDSLKDQINDLLSEQSNAHITDNNGKAIENPAISRSDMTNDVMEDKKKTREGKQDTLTRLFPKVK